MGKKNGSPSYSHPYTYPREEFIQDIENIQKKLQHKENYLLLTIFKFSDLDPYEFTRALNMYMVHGPRDFFSQVIKSYRKFSDYKTFEKIRKFITKYINNESDQEFAFDLLDELFQLRYVIEVPKLTNIADFFLQFTIEEIEFLTELGFDLKINPKPNNDWYKRGKWFWLNNGNVNLYYQSVLAPFLILNPNLRREDFKNLGFSRFISKIEKKGITYKVLRKRNSDITTLKLREKFGRLYLKYKLERAKKKLDENKSIFPDPSAQSLRRLVFTFLNSIAGQIERGEFNPTLKNILSANDKIKKKIQKCNFTKSSLTQPVSQWIKNNKNLPFENITEYKEGFFKKPRKQQLYNELYSSEFRVNKFKLNSLPNITIKKIFITHFNKIKCNNYPKEAFYPRFIVYDRYGHQKFVDENQFLDYPGKKEIIQNPRASMLCLRGSVSEKLTMKYIIKNLISVLKNNDRLIELPKTNYFSTVAQSKFDYYEQNQLKRPDNMHPDILKALLYSKNKKYNIKTVAIEVPIYLKLLDGSYFYGHIDSLSVKRNTIYMADYKPSWGEVFRFLPQIAAYGLMTYKLLNVIICSDFINSIENLSDIKIRCVSFTRNKAWVFNQDILGNEILSFVKKLNNIRIEPLMSVRLKGVDSPTPLYEDILKLLGN